MHSGVEERYLGRLITSRRRFDSGPRNTVVTPGTSTDRHQNQYGIGPLGHQKKLANTNASFFCYVAFLTSYKIQR